jgi:hypothetical protein
MNGVAEILRAIMSLLDDAAIPYMVAGSYASMVHGEPRTTHGLDIVIDPSPPALAKLLASIDLNAYYVDADVAREALRARSMFNVIDMDTAWKVDLVVRKDRPFSVEELTRRSPQRIADVDVPTASAEDTILAKLEWAKAGASDRQLADVAGIVRVRGALLDREYIERWLDALDVRAEWARALTLVT